MNNRDGALGISPHFKIPLKDPFSVFQILLIFYNGLGRPGVSPYSNLLGDVLRRSTICPPVSK